MTSCASPLSPTAEATAALTGALFAGRFETTHAPWRSLFDGEPFQGPPGSTHQERLETSYRRLRALNDAIDSVDDLVGDVERLAALQEWATPVDGGLSILAGIHYGLFLGSLRDHDQDPRRNIDDVRAMRHIGTFLCTELGYGNDAVRLATTATWTGDGFAVNTPTTAAQKFMPNTSPAGGAKTGVVAARLIRSGEDLGVFLFLTPLCDDRAPLPGVVIRRIPAGAGNRLDHCLTSFHDVRLPPQALLTGDHGRLAADGTFTSSIDKRRLRFLTAINRVTPGKLYMSSSALGGSRTALAIAVRYAHARHTTGLESGRTVPLIAHRTHHARLLEAVADIYAGTLLLRTAIARWGRDPAADERTAGLIKPWITWLSRSVVHESRERCGAQGLNPVNGIAVYMDLAEGGITAEGDNLVIWVKAAGELLTRQPSQASATAADEIDLANPHHLCELLGEVERIRHHRAQARWLGNPAPTRLEHWNATAGPALAAVDAHVGRMAADALLAAADDVDQPLARSLLLGLHRLFVLRRLADCGGDLLAEAKITADHVRALPDAIDATLTELAPHARLLVDAFAVSERLLAGYPIAHDDYISAFDSLVSETA